MEWIVDYFQKLFLDGGPLTAIAQCIGLLGLICTVGSLQFKTQKRISACLAIAGVFWTVHMLLLEAWAGAIMNGIGIVRAWVFMHRRDHAWARSKWWIAVFFVLCAGGAAFSAWQGDGWLAIFPLCGMILTTVALSSDDPFRVRILTLCNNPFWLSYNIINGSVSGILNECMSITSAIVGMLRLDLPAYRRKKREKSVKICH